MPVKISLEGTSIEKQMQAAATRNYRRVANSMRDATNAVVDEVEREWVKDVAGAGNFSQRWVDALGTSIVPKTGTTTKLALTFSMSIPYWRIHEFGGTILGRPMLWIPLSWTGIKIRAREYGRRYGLFRVEREGKNPLLLSIRDKKPKYVGVESVTLRQRFHLRRIIRRAAKNFGKYYRAAYRRRKGQ